MSKARGTADVRWVRKRNQRPAVLTRGRKRGNTGPSLPAIAPALSPQQPEGTSSGRLSGTVETFHVAVLDTQRGTTKQCDAAREWAILVATFRNARAVERLVMSGKAGQRFRRIRAVHNAINEYVNGNPRITTLPADEELIRLGCDLFEALFPNDVRRLYDVARAEQTNRRINFILTSEIVWFAQLPWEFVYDPARRTYLAASEINFTRNVMTQIPGDLLPKRPDQLRILVVAAQPLGLAHLSAKEEQEVVIGGFRDLIDSGIAHVDVLTGATPARLHQKLEAESYDVLHFIGHGEYDAERDLGCLVFENEAGGAQRVDAATLQGIMCRRNIRLIFLNACETGQGGKADFNRGVSPSLLQAGVPAVVGNQYSVLDVSATAFAKRFYWALAQGSSLGDAAREARVAVNYLISGEAIDWAVPVLFARDPTEVICAGSAPQPVPQESASRQTRIRRRAGDKRRMVALWDVQSLFPNLDQITDALNDAQDQYVFESVRIPAPLGTWRREPSKKKAYLRVDKVAERLEDKPAELGVDRIIAFTNLPMRDARTMDLVAWSEVDGGVSIFSTADYLPQITPPALSIERMIANACVAFLSGLEEHKRGPVNCPMYYNEERDVASIAGRLEFCQRCSRKLAPAARKTLGRLLGVY